MAEARQLPAGNLGYALAGLGRAYLNSGDIDEAEATLKRGVDTCRYFEITYYEVVITPLLANAYVQAGKPELAIGNVGADPGRRRANEYGQHAPP